MDATPEHKSFLSPHSDENKKLVTALLHACTFYCVSAHNVPWQHIAGNECQEYLGRASGNTEGSAYITGSHLYPAAFAGFTFPYTPDYFTICPVRADLPPALLPTVGFAPDICAEGNSVWIKYCSINGP
ncbi:MAG: hypothetical protein IPJ82_01615 [Lewinellaceae bacterium]|nr:hypothetical protein [Lewinellaceae bacterium]